jgi:SAM-dependent methyltransferase
MTDDEALGAEFDLMAAWTAQAVLDLGPEHAIPAGCRGSGSPDELTWLGEVCGLSPGTLLLDVGAGVGGPAAFAAENFGVRPLLVEPMPRACRAAAELFAHPVLVAGGDRLPLADSTADAVWCLGVLCTTEAKAQVLAEIHRVLRPGGSLGLLVLVADEPRPAGAPAGNTFPSRPDVAELLSGNGFRLGEQRWTTEFGKAPDVWAERIAEVELAVDRAHGEDRRLDLIRDQEARLGRLLDRGTVRSLVLHAVSTG